MSYHGKLLGFFQFFLQFHALSQFINHFIEALDKYSYLIAPVFLPNLDQLSFGNLSARFSNLLDRIGIFFSNNKADNDPYTKGKDHAENSLDVALSAKQLVVIEGHIDVNIPDILPLN